MRTVRPVELNPTAASRIPNNGGPGRIRTCEGVSQQIYSLPRLTAPEPTHRHQKPTKGLEPLTDGLQNRCSAN